MRIPNSRSTCHRIQARRVVIGFKKCCLAGLRPYTDSNNNRSLHPDILINRDQCCPIYVILRCAMKKILVSSVRYSFRVLKDANEALIADIATSSIQ